MGFNPVQTPREYVPASADVARTEMVEAGRDLNQSLKPLAFFAVAGPPGVLPGLMSVKKSTFIEEF